MTFLTKTMFSMLKKQLLSLFIMRTFCKIVAGEKTIPIYLTMKIKNFFLRNGFVSSKTTMASAANNLNMGGGLC